MHLLRDIRRRLDRWVEARRQRANTRMTERAVREQGVSWLAEGADPPASNEGGGEGAPPHGPAGPTSR